MNPTTNPMNPTMPVYDQSPPGRPAAFGPATERRITSRLSWSAIFAGAAVGLGVWTMLHVLGMGVGLTSIDPDDAGSLRGAGIGTGVWSLIAPVVALFVGGMVTGRVAGIFDRSLSAIHGVVAWAFAMVIGLSVVMAGVSAALGGTARLAGGVAGGAADVVGGAVGGVSESVANHPRTNLSRGKDVAAQIEQGLDERRDEIAARAEQVKTGALEAAETTGKAILGVFGSMLLALIAAAGGAMAGAALWQRRVRGA